MFKVFMVLASLAFAGVSQAQTVSGFATGEYIELWDASKNFSPVYYGEVTNGKGGHHACLALAFFKAENNKIHYAHKMWAKNGSGCDYDNVTDFVADNTSACVLDTDKKGSLKTRRMTLENITPSADTYRIVDFDAGRAGQFGMCPQHDMATLKKMGAVKTTKSGKVVPKYIGTAGIVSVKIENGRFKLHTTYPLIYNVNLNYVDTATTNPPSVKVY